jgi:hypothetical protein
MSSYAKASDSMINAVDANGKVHRVTQRAYDVVYSKQGYTLAGAEVVEEASNDVDYFALSREELEKIKNDDLKAFLDKEGLAYETKAIKEDLINVILGK